MTAREDGQDFWESFARSRADSLEGEGETAALALRGYCPVYDAYRHRSERRAVLSLLPRIERDWRILDLGCGPGRWTVPLAQAGARVTAVDFSPAMLDLAKRRCEAGGVTGCVVFRQGRLESIDCAELKGPFDAVLAFGVVQYIPQERLNDVAGRLAGCVKTGGVLLHRETLAPKPFTREAVCVESGSKTTSYYKSFEQYREAFEKAGLILAGRRSILPPSPTLSLLQRWFPCELNARNSFGRALYRCAIGLREVFFDPIFRLFPEATWRFNQRRPTDLAAVLYRRNDTPVR